MLRQYHPQRARGTQVGPGRWTMAGTIPIGTIARLASGPVMVLAWLPREIAAWRCAPSGEWLSCYVARGGHLALCRELGTGRMVHVTDHLLRHADDSGRTIDPREQPAPRESVRRRKQRSER